MHSLLPALLLACSGIHTPPVQAPVDATGLVADPLPAGASPDTWELFDRDNVWGYREAGGGAERIAPRFQTAGHFTRGGVAWAADSSGLVWINPRGAVVARAYNYDNGGDDFSEGLARLVTDDGLVGFIDETGAIAIPATWSFAAPFEAGRAVVCEGCTPEANGEHIRMVGGRWGAIDHTGALAVPLQHASWDAATVAAARRDLILDPAELEYDEAAGTATFHPDSRRQSAAYTRYVLDLASLEAVLGGRPTAPVPIVVELNGREIRIDQADGDPKVPRPEGGIEVTTWTGTVVAKG